jgi:hypothetical protein
MGSVTAFSASVRSVDGQNEKAESGVFALDPRPDP